MRKTKTWRAPTERVDTFSAPKALLVRAWEEAMRRGWTKSGFYRYCLAKECGLSEEEALRYAQPAVLRRSLATLAENVQTCAEQASALNESAPEYGAPKKG